MRPNDLRRRHRLLQISTWLSSLLATDRPFASPSSGCSPIIELLQASCSHGVLHAKIVQSSNSKNPPNGGPREAANGDALGRSRSLVHPIPRRLRITPRERPNYRK